MYSLVCPLADASLLWLTGLAAPIGDLGYISFKGVLLCRHIALFRAQLLLV